jgi:hypothetical protein
MPWALDGLVLGQRMFWNTGEGSKRHFLGELNFIGKLQTGIAGQHSGSLPSDGSRPNVFFGQCTTYTE